MKEIACLPYVQVIMMYLLTNKINVIWHYKVLRERPGKRLCMAVCHFLCHVAISGDVTV